ncbi:MAG: C1 family peptidase [Planctomycetes bacterium]|nr:C1 family peptidase [Planctomycetota bacterium]
MKSITRILAALLAALAILTSSAPAAERPAKFSLETQQTRYKDQGERGTCIAHSTLAALEAAYKRAGHGDLDLSEEFFIQMTKNFWLDPKQPDSATRAENRLSSHQGGHGAGYVRYLAQGFAVPAEADLGYRPHALPLDINAAVWQSQFNVNSNNLDPRRFDAVKLAGAKFYSVSGCEGVNGRDPEAIEEALVQNREVVWDFVCAGDMKLPLWRYTEPFKDKGDAIAGHSVLIVGYDRTDAANPRFIVKNSWAGQERIEITYDFLRNYGQDGATITAVAAPRTWTEIACIGRFYAEMNGKHGVLDIYHLPGINQMNFDIYQSFGVMKSKVIDRRVGTFYLGGDQSKAYRVNGEMTATGLKLVIDWQNPNAAYDNLKGETFEVKFAAGDKQNLRGAGFRAVRLKSKEAYSLRTPAWGYLPELKGW